MFRPLLNANLMRSFEQRRFTSGQSSLDAMEAAGHAVAQAILTRWPLREQVVVLAGPGNNGGDGYVVARLLSNAGKHVVVGAWTIPEELKGDALVMRRRWHGPTLPLVDVLPGIGPSHVVVDALFGIGLSRGVDPWLAEHVSQAAGRAAVIVAIDVPSGVDADSGNVFSDMIRADLTVTFGTKKPGHVLEPGRSRCGEVIVAPIGLAPSAEDIRLLGFDAFEVCVPRLSRPGAMDHKYSRGHVWVASGGMAATGAARLAARAALRVGAGVVTVASPREALQVNAAHLTAIMVRPADTADELVECLADERSVAMLIGPGFGVGRRTRDVVLALLTTAKPLVLDADALTSFEDEPDALFRAIRAPVVFTPHEGEFRRLFPMIGHQADKLTRVREAARLSGATVLLKGADTVVASPEGRAYVNVHSTPELATAGAGDVLAGTILGLMAQQRQLEMDSAQASAIAAWIHGEAGILSGPGLIAEDLPEVYPAILRRIGRS